MRVAILHYHLRPGGATRVIQNALSSLSNAADLQIVVVAGELPDSSMPVPNAVVIDGLGYYDPSALCRSPEDIIKDLEQTVKQQLGALPDVWHIHNYCLGKNLVMSEVTYLLTQKGHRLLLQPHDFAEDGRPDNYKFLRDHLCPQELENLGSRLYPQGRHVHYALINPRDLNFLKVAGVNSEQLHYLPNAVSREEALGEVKAVLEDSVLLQDIQRLFFYPARAIRRKNIGEFLLWSVLAEEGDRYAVARGPKNPLARPIYDNWVAFAQALKLPVEFALGENWQGDFVSLLQSAYALVSTSVAEGFGLAYLEPWMVRRPLLGRNLPEITSALERTGVDLSILYQRLDVPLKWIGQEQFQHEVQRHLQQVYKSYGRFVQADELERAINEAVKDEHVDFGKLSERFQQIIIRHLVDSSSSRKDIRPATLEPQAIQPDMIQQNRDVVIKQFNLQKYGERLLQLYQLVAESEVEPLEDLDTDVLLDQFLAPERFCLLRT